MYKRILVVDDEKSMLFFLGRIFSKEDIFIELAENGYDAIEKIKNTVYDLIITDLRMPGGVSGRDVMRSAKEQSEKTEIIIVY